MIALILKIMPELLRGIGVWLRHYYSPSEVKIRRHAKKASINAKKKKELDDAIVDESLNDLANIINARLRKRMFKQDEDPQRWREGFRGIGLKVPSEDSKGNGRKPS